MSAPLRLALLGATGRMGAAVQAVVAREPERWSLAACLGRDDELTAPADAVIDFSSAAGTEKLLAFGRQSGTPLVIGSTGHEPSQRAAIQEAAGEIAIVFAANFSVGINALYWLTREAARILGPGFDLEIVEMHHRLKKDAPSGTARRLLEILTDARGGPAVYGRVGLVGERPRAEIGVHAVRGGDVVGEHTVLFADAGERLELTHRASSRETFALGALRAAEWLQGRALGLYDMEDVLGLRSNL